MKVLRNRVWRLVTPFIVFVVVFAGHFVLLGLFPEQNAAQNRWVTIETGTSVSWLQKYATNQDYWLGFSYALSLAFAAYAIMRFREERLNRTRNVAIGGLTFTGFLAVAGCFLIGCCGSPMLAVYLTLFGATFLPFMKPIVLMITAVSIAGAFIWMNRRRQCEPDCGCIISSSGKVNSDYICTEKR